MTVPDRQVSCKTVQSFRERPFRTGTTVPYVSPSNRIEQPWCSGVLAGSMPSMCVKSTHGPQIPLHITLPQTLHRTGRSSQPHAQQPWEGLQAHLSSLRHEVVISVCMSTAPASLLSNECACPTAADTNRAKHLIPDMCEPLLRFTRCTVQAVLETCTSAHSSDAAA